MDAAAPPARPPEPAPLRGVLGVIDRPASVTMLRDACCGELPAGFELRADLLPSAEEALRVLRRLREDHPDRPVLFTLRLAAQGGRYHAGDAQRVAVYRHALASGAAMVDAEWGSEAARHLSREGAPLVLSHHDFRGMLSLEEIRSITREMESWRPAVVKLVPTAGSLTDGTRMLEWIEEGPDGGPLRVGFAMGSRGVPSRLLSIARGAPFTYGSLAGSVAPGQISVGEMCLTFRVHRQRRRSPVFGLAGAEHVIRAPHLARLNAGLRESGRGGIFVPLVAESLDEILAAWDGLELRGVIVVREGEPHHSG